MSRCGRVLAAALIALAATQAAMAGEWLPGPVGAEVVAVVDGDTLRVRAHVWLGQRIEVLVRLRGIDAPELRGRCDGEKALARAAAEELGRAVGGGSVRLANIEGDKYFGRVLADVEITPSGEDPAQLLLARGLARSYEGGRRGGWCGTNLSQHRPGAGLSPPSP